MYDSIFLVIELHFVAAVSLRREESILGRETSATELTDRSLSESIEDRCRPCDVRQISPIENRVAAIVSLVCSIVSNRDLFRKTMSDKEKTSEHPSRRSVRGTSTVASTRRQCSRSHALTHRSRLLDAVPVVAPGRAREKLGELIACETGGNRTDGAGK